MSKHYILFLLLIVLSLSNIFAQEDKTKEDVEDEFDEVVVTATRNETQKSAVPLPITTVSKKQITNAGNLRLNDILREQTGLFLVTEHGEGVQMQGFNPDYTKILIDGEPIVGRTAGTLELSRIAVGNIEKIEIVKGGASSLYGSEALAGVINIITSNSLKSSLSASARYGSNDNADFSLQGNWRRKKFNAYVFLNRYSSSGYDLTPESYGKTVEPFVNYTAQLKLDYNITDKLKFKASGRYFTQEQQFKYNIGSTTQPVHIHGETTEKDLNITSSLVYYWNSKLRTEARFYNSTYGNTLLSLNNSDNTIYEETYFDQTFTRGEIQGFYNLNERHKFTAGIGRLWESIIATRYTDKKYMQTNYAFLQYETSFKDKVNVILGARFDNHSVYGSQLSPKAAISYQINKKFSVRGSFGVGFKAPDFRQLYLNFNNSIAGYTVFGTEELPAHIAQLQAENQILSLHFTPDEIGNLKAERSTSFNIGFNYRPIKKIMIQANAFRNDVNNLIETQIAAIRMNGQMVYSYKNLNRIFTQGLEVNGTYNFAKDFSLNAGYQLLYAKDKDIIERLENGEFFRRDPNTFATVRVDKKDYGGLYNRSRHSYNIKLSYDNAKLGIFANVRAIYRGNYGFGDNNGNGILDTDAEYVKGYATIHASVGKLLWDKRIRLQVGVDNLFNHTNPGYITNLAGRLMWASVTVNLTEK